jgi:hypothetical protein
MRWRTAGPTGAAEEPAGDDRPDPLDGGKSSAVLGHGSRDLAGQRLEPLVRLAYLGDEVVGQFLAAASMGPANTHGDQQPGCG